ncbi:hypothetical protein DVS28_a4969 [Euzebya pacifica]|uniref:DUF222 domain-containing protein n=1 Tax=Euzebya pacifica TaxID=1608957 RepID=A0A346Y579_9ACTN|nr:hypothetical protein [Euzebya pacifica]AXV09626.1 hypothetical protein DVS28_a4969 [Euzebya pacifica]
MTELVTHLHTLASRFDPDQIPDTDVAGLVVDLGRAGRLVDGMLTRAARRAAETSAHETTGVKDAATLIATATGTSTAAAKKMLKTSSQLVDQPDVDKAVTDGTLSTDQAVVVSETVADAPEKAGELIVDATTQTLPELRKKARDIRTAADPDRETTRRRHLARRAFRSWTETDGEWKAFLSGPGDLGARIEAALRGEHDAVFRTAHAAGQREDDACYRFDALLNLLEGRTADGDAGPTPKGAAETPATGTAEDGETVVRRPRRTGRQTKVIIRVDGSALVRGELADGETCEIAGIGRVALSAVREQIPDAHVAYVITNGTDTCVAHLGRQVTAHQRTALEARGYQCEVPGSPPTTCWRSTTSPAGPSPNRPDCPTLPGCAPPTTDRNPDVTTGCSAHPANAPGPPKPAWRSAATHPRKPHDRRAPQGHRPSSPPCPCGPCLRGLAQLDNPDSSVVAARCDQGQGVGALDGATDG